MIRQNLWGRLNALKTGIRSRHVQHLFIFMKDDDTMQDLEARIERWKAGEVVYGISAEYEGGEIEFARPFQFVGPGED